MKEKIKLPKDGKLWWKTLLGIDIQPTAGEIKNNSGERSTPDSLLASQEAIDARRLIQLGNRTNDPEIVRIGKKRLSTVMGWDGE